MEGHNYILSEITPLSNQDCFYIADRLKSEFTFPIHSHTEYELNFIEHAPRVKRVVGDSTEIIGDYDLVLITGRELEHAWEQNTCTSKQIREVTIQFSKDIFGNMIQKTQFDSIRKMIDRAQCGLSFPMEAIMKVYNLIDTLSTEERGFHAVMKFFEILYELSLFDNAQELSSSSFAKARNFSESRRVEKIQNYIAEHYHETIRLETLAELVGMTPVSFSRFFKLHTGKTLSEYVIDIRLGFASRLLIDSSRSVAEICYECGFNNLSNFNRIFKRKKDCTPKEFRGSYRKKKLII